MCFSPELHMGREEGIESPIGGLQVVGESLRACAMQERKGGSGAEAPQTATWRLKGQTSPT